MSEEKPKRGFAAMDPEKQHEIASKGGKASHGRKHKGRGFAGMDPEKQHEIAKKGGQARAEQRKQQKMQDDSKYMEGEEKEEGEEQK